MLIIAISGWIGCIFFYHLGESGIQNTDEARHIVNAYEMMKSGNIWINTYRYATDYYNFKPPFSLWCIMLNFKIFGISLFSARLYAATSMFLMYALLMIFLWKKIFGSVIIDFWNYFFLSDRYVFLPFGTKCRCRCYVPAFLCNFDVADIHVREESE